MFFFVNGQSAEEQLCALLCPSGAQRTEVCVSSLEAISPSRWPSLETMKTGLEGPVEWEGTRFLHDSA